MAQRWHLSFFSLHLSLYSYGGDGFFLEYVHGYKFTQHSKQELMTLLMVTIQKGEIGFPDNELTFELQNFGYEITRTGTRYESTTGHDDCVMALALAVKCFDEYGRVGWGIW